MLRKPRHSAGGSHCRTPSLSRARTPGGMIPSPHALSGISLLRSKTATERPRPAASMATASPAGPAPTTATSSMSLPAEEPGNQARAIAKGLGVAGAQRAFLLGDANGEEQRVAYREHGGRHECTVNE